MLCILTSVTSSISSLGILILALTKILIATLAIPILLTFLCNDATTSTYYLIVQTPPISRPILKTAK